MRISAIVACVFAIYLLAHLSLFSYFLASVSDPRGVLSARDDDAGVVVSKAVRSRWYNDNGWVPYGPFYMRTIHSLHQLVYFPFSGLDEGTSRSDSIEKGHHFLSMWVSLICLYALSALLGLLVSRSLWIPFSLVFFILFSQDPVWVEMIFRAHPDVMFAFLIALATHYTLVAVRLSRFGFEKRKPKRAFIVSAICWGLAASTKLSIILFIPFLVLLWLVPIRKHGEQSSLFPDSSQLRTALKYWGYAFLAYLLIGFPQNFIFGRAIRFLMDQSRHSMPIDWERFSRWWELWFSQGWRPALLILLSAILPVIIHRGFGSKVHFRLRLSLTQIAQVSLLTILPFALLISRGVSSPHTYYTLPFVASHLVILAFILRSLRSFSAQPLIKKPALQFALILLVLSVVNAIPEGVKASLEKHNLCREEAHEVYKIVSDLQRKTPQILLDPYVPYAQGIASKTPVWWTTLEDFRRIQPHTMVLNKKYYQRLLGKTPGTYMKRETNKYFDSQKFYQPIAQVKEVGGLVKIEDSTFRLSLQRECGWQVWEQTDLVYKQKPMEQER